jgi:hypothetical protein
MPRPGTADPSHEGAHFTGAGRLPGPHPGLAGPITWVGNEIGEDVPTGAYLEGGAAGHRPLAAST